jgi:hypothetical protein
MVVQNWHGYGQVAASLQDKNAYYFSIKAGNSSPDQTPPLSL